MRIAEETKANQIDKKILSFTSREACGRQGLAKKAIKEETQIGSGIRSGCCRRETETLQRSANRRRVVRRFYSKMLRHFCLKLMISDSGHEMDALGHAGEERRIGHERVR